MIELIKVNKYFNRHKKNQIHVINDTSLKLEDTGLVALLGPSGCGKTTLLNTIGGLDKVNKGKIIINGQKITKRSVNKIDKIRNLNIGYIFQDYNLIDNMSVFDNVALPLKMLGIKNKKEIKERVNFVLDKINMYRYRNRPAYMLSGGERQRVGIARAIVKNPAIIIADEPTGNLDSKNTIEIMNIIAAISKTKLVILVTHEKNLAYFYASRVIELQDGKVIADYENNHENDLDYRIDNKIYLKDIKKCESVTKSNLKINYYDDENEKIGLDIVIKDNNIYIQTDSDKKIEVIDNNSNLELIDDHYQKITKKDYEKYEFGLENIVDKKARYHYSSIFNPITTLTEGFKRVFAYSFLKKLLLLGFFISAMFILYSVSNMFGILNIKDEKFVTQNKNYLMIINNKPKVEDYLSYEQENINYLLPGDSIVNFKFNLNFYYQTYYASDVLTGSLSSLNMITKDDLILGKLPTNIYEIVVDKLAITKMLDILGGSSYQTGITSYEKMLNQKVNLDNMNPFTIVGIVDLKSPCIYANENMFINIIANSFGNENSYGKDFVITDTEYIEDGQNSTSYIDYELKKEELTLKRGKYPLNDYEVVVNINNKYSMPLNKKIDTKINNQKLKVVGYYEDEKDSNYYLVNNNTIKYNLITTKKNITIYGDDKVSTLELYRSKNLNVEDAYIKAKNSYVKSRNDSITITLVISGIILAISFIEIFLIIRSSFLSRIKEIGVLRAIGVKKKDIYKIFLGEILAITSTASLLGLIFMTYIVKKIINIKYLGDYYLLDYRVLLVSIIVIYVFNIIIGLLPVMNTIRKTPASILSRTDID